jgi:hypothetical protein
VEFADVTADPVDVGDGETVRVAVAKA